MLFLGRDINTAYLKFLRMAAFVKSDSYVFNEIFDTKLTNQCP